MKQKYTLNIADIQLNVVADMAPEQVDKIAGILDRKMREFYLNSRFCTKNEAALLCALEFCSERLELQSRTSELQALNAKYETVLKALQERNGELNQELEKLKSENTLLRSLITTKAPAGIPTEVPATEPTPSPVSAADFLHEVATATESAPGTDRASQPVPGAAGQPTAPKASQPESRPEGRPEGRPADSADADKRRSRMGSMFDLLSFDDD